MGACSSLSNFSIVSSWGRGCNNRPFQNPGIAKIGFTCDHHFLDFESWRSNSPTILRCQDFKSETNFEVHFKKVLSFIRVNLEIYDKHLPRRNCLMDQNHVVKIADFGLSQKMFLQDYYRCRCNDTSIEFCSQTLQCTGVILKLCNAGGKRAMRSQFGGCPLSRSSTTSESLALAKKCKKHQEGIR